MMLAWGAKMLMAIGLGDRMAKRLSLLPWLLLALLVALLLFLAGKWAVGSWMDRTIATAEDAGATRAVVAGQNQTLNQLGDANNAERDLRTGGERSAIAYSECLRNNTRPGACERYNPDAGEQQLVPGR